MRRGFVRAAGITGGATLTLALASCSLDTIIWGPDGAAVIDTTNRVIAAASAGDATALVCAGAAPEMGAPEDWTGLAAEEPERLVGDHWPDQAALDAAWSINVSLPVDRVAGGTNAPGDLFFRDTDDGLCLVDVAWSTVEFEG
ncbi:hypothetical protein SAMN05880568_1741 [Microbacterium sp. RURRCA19A]|nr:hypothetical protein SAMN05880568_1741 [Microbacterium sp. RURRCA19A]